MNHKIAEMNKNFIKEFDNSWPHVEYSELPPEKYLIPHLGQRKLLIAEVAFLTKYNHIDTIVYAGAGKGFHLKEIAKLFPKKIFYLYDPRGFFKPLENHKNLIMFSENFTDKHAEHFGNKKKFPNILFISDIRTSSKDFEEEVLKNLNQQYKWCSLIKPDMASIKFRLPYDHSEKVKFYSGKLKIQAWAKIQSGETRLWTNCLETIEYCPIEYEKQMAYYNTNLRLGPYNVGQCDQMDFCNDCAIEWTTWLKYAKKFKKPTSWCQTAVATMSDQEICVGPHCLMRDLPLEERLIALHDKAVEFYKFYHQRENKKNF